MRSLCALCVLCRWPLTAGRSLLAARCSPLNARRSMLAARRAHRINQKRANYKSSCPANTNKSPPPVQVILGAGLRTRAPEHQQSKFEFDELCVFTFSRLSSRDGSLSSSF